MRGSTPVATLLNKTQMMAFQAEQEAVQSIIRLLTTASFEEGAQQVGGDQREAASEDDYLGSPRDSDKASGDSTGGGDCDDKEEGAKESK